MKIAVTGAAGFVGTNLLQRLVDEGHDVVAIDRVQSPHAPGRSVTWVQADILDPEAMRRALDGCELVYHLVAVITLAHRDDHAWRLNTEGVRTVARAALAAGVRRMIHVGSVHSFDQMHCQGFLDEDSPRSASPDLPVYDRSKWQGELLLQEVVADGLDAVICNPTGVYGPRDFGLSRLNGILRDAARGRVPVAVTGGFDLVDVRDVTKGLILAADKGRTGENYLLSGQLVTILEVCRLAARATGRRGPVFAIPVPIINAIMPIAEPIGRKLGSDVVSRASMAALVAAPFVDGSKAHHELGYTPRPTVDTIRDLVAFLVHSDQI